MESRFHTQQKLIEQEAGDQDEEDNLIVTSSEDDNCDALDEPPNVDKFKYSNQDLSSQSDSDQESQKTDSAREQEMAIQQEEIENANNSMPEPFLD